MVDFCNSSKAENINSSYLNEKLLIGTWISNEINSYGFYLSTITYTADGLKCTLGTSYNKRNVYSKSIYISKWNLHGNSLDVTVVKTSTPLLAIGETLSGQVISLTESELKTRLYSTEPGFENSPIETYKKISNAPDLTVCETAKRLL